MSTKQNSSYKQEPFDFELLIDGNEKYVWMKENWYYSIHLSAAYLLMIYILKKYMKERPAFELKRSLVVWNIILSIFSLMVTIRVLPGFYHIISDFGFTSSVCEADLVFNLKATMFWSWFFLLSKVLEFGDTVFILLRKRKLIFLHVYHHVLTLVMSWYSSGQKLVIIHWFLVMNSTVHSFMYTYYALAAMKFKLPSYVAICITSLQILQMLVGSTVVGWVIIKNINGETCDFHRGAMVIALLSYLSYGYLFCNYFYNVYIKVDIKKKPL